MSSPLRWLKSRPGLYSITLTKSKDQTRQAFQESCHCTSITLGKGSLQREQNTGDLVQGKEAVAHPSPTKQFQVETYRMNRA